MLLIPFICAIIGGILVLLISPWWIRFIKKIELVVPDMNKENKPLVPISGGLIVMSGAILTIFLFIFLRTFVSKTGSITIDERSLTYLFAVTTLMLISTFIGFIDDLLIERKIGASKGLKQWQKPILTLAAAVPLMAIAAGNYLIWTPLFKINFGILYSLLIVPIAVVGASNMVNMLEGYNGLGSGMGLIYMGMLGLYAYINDKSIAALIALSIFIPLLIFYFYNKYPAKILPGDSLTYLLGASLAAIAILGDMEKAALIISIPFFIEFFLKLRSKFKAHSFGHYEKGKIKSDYAKIYSIPHIFARTGKFTEKQIVYFMILMELIFSSLIWII